MVVDKSPLSGNALEQFVILAKSTKGAACVELIKQVLEAPGVYVFGELLDMPNIQELGQGAEKNLHNTLELFAFGTYKDYLSNKNKFLELTRAQKKKLQHLTIVTLAAKSKCIPYNTLLVELDIKNVRDLEDLIIEAIYADIIHGKLDQKNSQLEVDYAIGRDIRSDDIKIIIDCLQDWCSSCEGVLSCVETQIHRANMEKNKSMQRKTEIETEISNIRKALRSQVVERPEATEEAMATDNREASSVSEKGKKTPKVTKSLKILR